MSDQKDDIICYRLERATQALDEARYMAEAGHWNACVNRLYYACFYAACALLARHELSSSKYSGMRSLFGLHFVRTGIIPKHLAAVYNDLFENRQDSDYKDFVRMEETTVRPWIDQAKAFVEYIANLLEKG